MASNKALIAQLEGFLATINPGSVKTAAEEPSTSHPVGNAEDSTVPVSEGARSSENSSDIKSMVPGEAVDEAAKAKAPETPISNMGTKSTATGEDPAVEDNYQGTVPDPGTSSNMTSDDGKKYSCATLDDIVKLANEINAGIAVAAEAEKREEKDGDKKEDKDGEKADEKKEECADGTKCASLNKDFVKAGYDAAANILNSLAMQKQAEDAQFEQAVSEIVKQAELDAENLIGFLKAAAEDESGEEKEEKPEDSEKKESKPAEGDVAPAEAAMLAPEAALGGIEATLPAVPAGDAAPVDGGSELSPEEVEALAQALAQEGIDPEELASIDPAELEAVLSQIGGDAGAPAAGGDMSGLIG